LSDVPLAIAVDRVFAEDGPLAAALDGYEPRAAQREMAAGVARALAEGGVLLAEAGTGTGKTLAYLVPAILKREQVLISTGTRNLQEQIFEKDLPLLQEVLRTPFTATCMKGRGNYVCLQRLEAADQGPAQAEALPGMRRLDVPALLQRIRTWAADSDTGDRAELDDLPDDLPLWHDISASAENCLGTDCPRYHDCFVTRMRQRAERADVVIVNHHLLLADASVRRDGFGEVIPDAPHAVLDEAHQLEEIATQYFGVAVSTRRVDDFAGDVERWSIRALRGGTRDATLAGADHVRRHARRLFLGLDGARTGPDERVRLSADLLAAVGEAGADATGTLDGLAATLVLLQQQSAGEQPLVTGEMLDELQSLARRAGAIRDDLQFLLRAADDDFVFFLEVRGRTIALRAAPIDVARIVREHVIDRRRTAVFTSATLAVDRDFQYIKSRLGIGKARALTLASEFDYRRQALLYLPRRMPPPRSPHFPAAASAEILAILQRTQGRAFVLFTSYAMLRAVRQAIEGTLDYPLLVQGDAPRSALLARFRQTPHAVLLATSSFWQGVDVIGDALSCVIIDKLPFASPGDPITAARLETLAARGGDPFADYQVPLAILTLLQGLGRLLRHRLDRGVLAILDPRLRTMGYGRRFLDALPPAPVTSNADEIARFFAGNTVDPSLAPPRRPGPAI
jgi:ATP-dependent DNA helicase DinG